MLLPILFAFQVEKGEISFYEYDHVISTIAMTSYVNKIKKILKEKFPDSRDGTSIYLNHHLVLFKILHHLLCNLLQY